jgi:hypothetical protein
VFLKIGFILYSVAVYPKIKNQAVLLAIMPVPVRSFEEQKRVPPLMVILSFADSRILLANSSEF